MFHDLRVADVSCSFKAVFKINNNQYSPPLGVEVVREFYQELQSSKVIKLVQFKRQNCQKRVAKDGKCSIVSISFISNLISSCSIDLVL